MQKKQIYFTLLLTLLFACNREPIIAPPTDLKLEYFPLDIGKYWVYAVDSIVYDPIVGGIEQDSVRLYVKEEVVDTFRDATGMLMYRIDRYERYADTMPWQIALVVAEGIEDDKSAIRIEHNLRFSKLVFPPFTGKQWEANSAFDTEMSFPVAGEGVRIFRQMLFYIKGVDEPYEFPDLAFDSVTTVMGTNFPETCSLEYRTIEEKYAKNVGLIFREWIILDEVVSAPPDTCVDAPWRDKAEAGFVIRQTLIDYK